MMETKNYVTYEEFGAKGDGVTNDFPAIYAAHVYANENGLPVKANDNATYYIKETWTKEGDLTSIASAPIMTETDWGNANFIIDDTEIIIPPAAPGKCLYTTHIFKIISDYPEERIEDKEILDGIIAGGLNPDSKKVNIKLDYPAMIIPFDSSYMVYRRCGYGLLSYGKEMHEVIVIDKDGNIDPETSVIFNYNRLDYVLVIRLDIKPLTVKGGIFTTLACRQNMVRKDPDGTYSCPSPYISRGISANRSYATVKNVRHYVKGELTVPEQISDGKVTHVCPCYSGFLTSIKANEVTFEDCVLTGRRCYTRPSYAKHRGTGGTYDFRANSTNKIVLKNVVQSNFWVKLGENDEITPAKEGEEGAITSLYWIDRGGQRIKLHWGIGESDFCKNVEYHGCTMSRFDAHEGLYNGKITNSTVNYISLTGSGTVTVENTRWFAEGDNDGANSLFHLREDYGHMWDGKLIAKNVKAYVYSNPGLVYTGYRNWFYGYKTHMPDVDVEGLEYYDIHTREPLAEGSKIRTFTINVSAEPQIHLATTLNKKPRHEYADFDGDGKVDNLDYDMPYDPSLRAQYANGIDGGSNMNLNPVTPPRSVSIKGNAQGLVYTVQDTSDYMNVPDGGLYGKTEFSNGKESCIGTAGKLSDTLEFIPVE